MKNKIEFEDFLANKIEIKAGKVISVTDVPKSKKLIKLEVDFDEESPRVVLTNIKPILGEDYVEKLLNNTFLFITNLKPVEMMGIESQAMILVGELEEKGLTSINSKPGTLIL
jgi:methionyl-tRNA synthetase